MGYSKNSSADRFQNSRSSLFRPSRIDLVDSCAQGNCNRWIQLSSLTLMIEPQCKESSNEKFVGFLHQKTFISF